MSLALRRLRTKLGAEAGTLLSLRHFAPTQLLAAGVDVRTVAGRLGHAQPSTTLNRYTEWLQARDQDAAETVGDILAPRPNGSALASDGMGKGGDAPTSPPSTGARREAIGAGSRPRSGPE